jgi:hypothetical protein
MRCSAAARRLMEIVGSQWTSMRAPFIDNAFRADYLRCDIPLSLALTFNGKQFPVHPLDMSDYTSTDPSHKTCLGLIQYASGLTAGDL